MRNIQDNNKHLKKGISLVILMITIIVILILASAVIMNLNNNNVITDATETQFKANAESYRAELNLWISNEYSERLGLLDETEVNADNDTITFEGLKMQDIIKTISNSNAQIFEIVEGKLVYKGEDELKEQWCKELGIEKVEEPLKYKYVYDIIINSSNLLNVKRGESMKFEAIKVQTGKVITDVTWKISNPNIATVDIYGNVQFKETGMVTLTAESSNGSTDMTVLVVKP